MTTEEILLFLQHAIERVHTDNNWVDRANRHLKEMDKSGMNEQQIIKEMEKDWEEAEKLEPRHQTQ